MALRVCQIPLQTYSSTTILVRQGDRPDVAVADSIYFGVSDTG